MRSGSVWGVGPAREQELLSGLLKKQTEAFRDHPEDAAALSAAENRA